MLFEQYSYLEENIMADALAIAINMVSIILAIISLYLALR